MDNYNHTTIEEWKAALRCAAEDMYQSEMIDTNMAVLEISEVAGAYEHYENDEERQEAIQSCIYETKEDWINDRIHDWIDAGFKEWGEGKSIS